MALTAPAQVSVSIVDELGTTSTSLQHVMVDPTAPLAALAATAQAYASTLDAVISGRITDVRATLLPGLPAGLKAAAAVGSRVEQTAVLNFIDQVSPKKWGSAIPSIADAMITNGKINLTNAAIEALVVLITTPTATAAFATPVRTVLHQAVDIFLSFRKRRKQLNRSSFEYDNDAAHGGV